MSETISISSATLISSKTIVGSDVFSPTDEKLGTIEDILVDKVSGRTIYAVLSFGGFLGMGERHHPLPWSTLAYDVVKNVYRVNLDKKHLEDAPSYDRNKEFSWTPEYGRTVDSYYKSPNYWN
ncbi:PRC-barrel domain-containing protein [Magnetospirillum fulvum]|uniref:PRC-barrel domain-containing protein n=1 Tax=Magnetospirillum fulvum TaxID=1082 RepID=A0A1H6H9P3_MAGFU|nr:PRC-barrel domain-containing protein [Magnetospirillum fulvum]SEH30828.1 PRC-barrel domain-containing protein [Magnetospirillum fulvum]